MRKAHLILLIITIIMTLFSAYSLAAISQVYSINFEWYSQYNDRFEVQKRDTSQDKWHMEHYPQDSSISIIKSTEDYIKFQNQFKDKLYKPLMDKMLNEDYDRYILIYCNFGVVDSPEYRIKVCDIAQRGNVIEVKVSMNSPEEREQEESRILLGKETKWYNPIDVIRIERDSFSTKGGLYFIFKNQSGEQVFEKYYEVG